MDMTILSWIIFGLIVGILAHVLDPHPTKSGIRGTIALSILGAFIGGLLSRYYLGTPVLTFNLTSLVISILCAMLLIFMKRGLVR